MKLAIKSIRKYRSSTFHERKAERIQEQRKDCPWKCQPDDPKCLCLIQQFTSGGK